MNTSKYLNLSHTKEEVQIKKVPSQETEYINQQDKNKPIHAPNSQDEPPLKEMINDRRVRKQNYYIYTSESPSPELQTPEKEKEKDHFINKIDKAILHNDFFKKRCQYTTFDKLYDDAKLKTKQLERLKTDYYQKQIDQEDFYFHPCINTNHTVKHDKNIHLRSQEWKNVQVNKLDKMKQQQQEKLDKQCTFKPDIFTSNSNVQYPYKSHNQALQGSNSKGVEEYLLRQLRARKKNQKTNFNQNKTCQFTIPEEFVFSDSPKKQFKQSRFKKDLFQIVGSDNLSEFTYQEAVKHLHDKLLSGI